MKSLKERFCLFFSLEKYTRLEVTKAVLYLIAAIPFVLYMGYASFMTFGRMLLGLLGYWAQFIPIAILFAVIIKLIEVIIQPKPEKKDTSSWQSIRRTILRRDFYRCTVCESTVDLHVHHMTSVGKGGSDSPSNLTTLCKSCHMRVHPYMKKYDMRR